MIHPTRNPEINAQGNKTTWIAVRIAAALFITLLIFEHIVGT